MHLLNDLLCRIPGSRSRGARGRRSLSVRRLGVEHLETRTLLSAAPVLISGADSVLENTPYVLNLTHDDMLDVVEWSIDWGDSSDPDGDGTVGEKISGNPSSVTHTYASQAEFVILAAATDGVGTSYAAVESDVGTFLDKFVSPDNPGGNGGLNWTTGITFGPDQTGDGLDDLYVGSNFDVGVNLYDGSTGAFIREFVSAGDLDGGFAKDVVFGPDGNLYLNEEAHHRIMRFDGTTGELIDVFVPAGSAGMGDLRGMTFGPDRSGDSYPDLYVSSQDTAQVLVFDGESGEPLADSKFIWDDPGTPNDETGGLVTPGHLVFRDDFLYVRDGEQGILRYNALTGEFVDQFLQYEHRGEVGAFVFGPDGDLYVTSVGQSSLRKDIVYHYDGETGRFIDVVVPESSGLPPGRSIDFDANGNLYVAGSATSEVLRYAGPFSTSGASQHAVKVLTQDNFESTDTPQAIPDAKYKGKGTTNGVVASQIYVSEDFEVFDVNVTLDISHTYDKDLVVDLIGPDGTRVNLFSRIGGAGQNFTGTVLDDESGRLFEGLGAPYTGTYQPNEPLWKFDGLSAQGTWTLEITDVVEHVHNSSGTLNSWSLEFTGFSAPAAPAAVDDSYASDVDMPLVVASPGVLENDSDSNGDPLSASVVSGSGPSNGSLAFNADGSFTYTPNAGFTGTDSFQYVANDGTADSNAATVTITVADASAIQSFSSTDTPLAITDAHKKAGARTTTSQLQVSGTGITIDSMELELSINHPSISDLSATLTGPSGTVIPIEPLASGTVTYSNIGFVGEALDGNWTISITDHVHGNTGTLEGWTLHVMPQSSSMMLALSALSSDSALSTDSTESDSTIQRADLNGGNDATAVEETALATQAARQSGEKSGLSLSSSSVGSTQKGPLEGAVDLLMQNDDEPLLDVNWIAWLDKLIV